MNKLFTALGLTLAVSLNAQASIIGDSVNAAIINDFGGTIDQQFASPVVVGAGTEFSGSYTDVFGAGWTFNIDLGAHQFTVSFSSVNDWGNVFMNDTANSIIRFDLGDLNWGSVISNVAATGYACDAQFVSCNINPGYQGLGNVNLLSFSDNDIHLGFNGLYNGETYTFTVTSASVAEPSALMLLGAGLLGFGAARRRH
jgi:hypothetical protein